MKIVQIGSNKAYDDLSNHILQNYKSLEFGLFVEPNKLHNESIKKCYEKYSNIILENIAIKTPLHEGENLRIYYHTNDYPDYQLASCNIEHIKNHLWVPHLWRDGDGEIKYFEVESITLEELFQKYEIEELDWLCLDIEGIDAEILLTTNWKKYKIKRIEFEHLHLGFYRESIYNMMIGMGYTKIDSLHEYDWAFENKNIIFANEKLKNFPSLNFISIEESNDRREVLYQNFEKFGITDVTPHIYKRYNDEEHNVICGPSFLHISGRGPVTSHLKAIREWYENTNEPYTFFCEDDLSFETVEYWNFTWEEFFSKLPSNWGCVQLALVREDMFYFYNPEVRLRHRCFDDWSGCAYLISRNHAQKLVENYYYDDCFHLEYKGTDRYIRYDQEYAHSFILPQIENIVYSYFGDIGGVNSLDDGSAIYVFPLFVENVNLFSSTWVTDNVSLPNRSSYEQIINWWKTRGKDMTLDQLITF